MPDKGSPVRELRQELACGEGCASLRLRGVLPSMRYAGKGAEPSGRRPAVVVQHDRFNRSAIQTTVVAAITSDLRMAAMPGNVRLRKGEANLPRPSVINVSRILTIDRERLTACVGTLSGERVRDVLGGLALVFGLD